MSIHRTCDGVARRDFLKVGVLGATSFTLANYLRHASAGETTGARSKAAIYIALAGGPSHMDTFDLKPNSPTEYRGEFSPIETNVPGLMISEHLPNLAKCADKYTLLRGVTHTLAAHNLGQEYVNTGNRPLASLQFPGFGSVVSKELQSPPDLPPFVAIPNTIQRGGYLGVKYAPFNTEATPMPGKPFNVRGISLGQGLTVTEVQRRQNLLSDLDVAFEGYEANNSLLDGLDRFSQQAHSIITSSRAREAFDVSREDKGFSETFGSSNFGQSCLLATRLVEAGVRFVTISSGGWDTHRDNWKALKERQLPPFDQAVAALLNGLQAKGLLESTTVFITGEFGRTPKINNTRVGRDHYPRNMFMLLAGGGIPGGRVLGESDEKGEAPVGDGFSPSNVAATFYHTLGIDHTKEYYTSTGRPVMIVREGDVIPEVLG